MLNTVDMPRQMPSVERPLLLRFFKTVGDKVGVGELLFSYEADGAVFEENSAVTGEIVACFFRAGDRVSGGVPIMAVKEK